MCNLYSMTRNREAILRLFRVSHNRASVYEPRDAIFPGYQAPVVRKAADGERELVVLNWGFVLLQKDKAPKRVTNIRDDKAQSKFWRTSFEQRRCLVPASSYCEPKGEKPATWHWFSINGDSPRPVFAFPGVWTRYKGPLKKNGDTVEQEVFAFMTTEPNELTASINHERMPVLLTDAADFETWLSGSTEDAFKLARSYAADQMGSERKDLLAHDHGPVARLNQRVVQTLPGPVARHGHKKVSTETDRSGTLGRWSRLLGACPPPALPRAVPQVGGPFRPKLGQLAAGCPFLLPSCCRECRTPSHASGFEHRLLASHQRVAIAPAPALRLAASHH